MRVLYLTQWFEPEPAFKGIEFVKALATAGHEVEVATAFPNYPGGKLYPGYNLRPYQRNSIEGVTVHRLFVWPSHDRSSLGRILNYLSFWLSSLLFGLIRCRAYDAIYVYHPPLTPSLAAAMFCWIWRRPFIMDIQDLWPESVGASGMAGGRIVAVLDALCRFTYRRSKAIIVQSEGIKARLLERGVPPDKLQCIRNWSTYRAEPDTVAPGDVHAAFRGKINIVYGGNLGQAQGLGALIAAGAAAAANNRYIHLHLFGSGIERERLAKQIVELDASDHITIHNALPRRTMDRVFDIADVLVMHLKSDPLFDITIPSKTQHYLSCGKPIVAGLSGEAADILRESGAAIVTPPEDVHALAKAMGEIARLSPLEREKRGARGRAYYAANLALEPAITRTAAVLDQVRRDPASA